MSTDNDTDTTADETFSIDADGEVTLPVVDVLTGRGFMTGKSGSGKSTSVSVVAEELLKRSHPLMIVDTDGEYYGLKEQFQVLHVGTDEECDIRVGPEHAEKLATLALEQHVPIVLDVSDFLDEDEMRELILEVARHLFAKAKKLRRRSRSSSRRFTSSFRRPVDLTNSVRCSSRSRNAGGSTASGSLA